ncbi:putative transposable element [Trichonephila clavipes]|nr:putative transposable element [Trichonephila clavipes]
MGWWNPYFFKNDESHNVTVNGDRYRAMSTNFFIPELNNPDVLELWFQQDGATCSTARATIDLLKDTFGDRVISRFGPVNWPLRSVDLTPLDYFLWVYVKDAVVRCHHSTRSARPHVAKVPIKLGSPGISSLHFRFVALRVSHFLTTEEKSKGSMISLGR